MRRFKVDGVFPSVVFEGMRRAKREKGKARGLSAAQQAALCEAWGLCGGCVLRAMGARFVFGRVGGVLSGGKPWVWAYRLKKNGTTYADATRLERWEKE